MATLYNRTPKKQGFNKKSDTDDSDITWSGRLGLSWGDLVSEVEWVMVSMEPIYKDTRHVKDNKKLTSRSHLELSHLVALGQPVLVVIVQGASEVLGQRASVNMEQQLKQRQGWLRLKLDCKINESAGDGMVCDDEMVGFPVRGSHF